jgi:hypothetical protein
VGPLLLIAWFVPTAGALMILAGAARALHVSKREFTPTTALMIIQITTVGNEETVNEIIRRIRGYNLTIPHTIWVVTEPWAKANYRGADELVVVPEDFRCQAAYKARALEYSRRLRSKRGLNDYYVRVLFVDDDSVPTKSYIEKVFMADFDVCEGIPTPRTGYGRWLSHMDDLRTINCLCVCSLFQGFGHPIHVHGEGLCVRGTAEALVTWDYPMFASEDLVFGHMAVIKGMTWGFIWDYIEITSPFTWRDFVTQRRRWLWGNVHAIRYILPIRSSILLVAQYFFGLFTFAISSAGVVLALTGKLHLPSRTIPWLFGSMALWLAVFAVSGAINSGGGASRGLRRVRDVAVAVLLALVTSAVAVGIWVVAFFKGNPRRFDVIQKMDPKARGTSLADTVDHGASTGSETVVPIPEPVILLPDPVGSLAERSAKGADEGSS